MTRPTFISTVALLAITGRSEPPVKEILWLTFWGAVLAAWGRMGW